MSVASTEWDRRVQDALTEMRRWPAPWWTPDGRWPGGDPLALPVDCLELSVRAQNLLDATGDAFKRARTSRRRARWCMPIPNVREICRHSRAGLVARPGMGRKTVAEIEAVVVLLGYGLYDGAGGVAEWGYQPPLVDPVALEEATHSLYKRWGKP